MSCCILQTQTMLVRHRLNAASGLTQVICAVNHIRVNEEQSSGLIKGIDLGVLAPGATATKTVYLTSTGGAGDRHLDFSFQATSIDDNKTAATLSPEAPSLQDSTELLESLVVPTINPFGLEHKAVYRRTTHAAGGILDLATFEGDYWDDADGGEAVLTTSLTSIGPWTVQIENCRLLREVTGYLRSVFHSH
jgi:hypothetical protein